jgi:hypothetical protein
MDFIFIETYHIYIYIYIYIISYNIYIKAEFQLRVGLELGHVA